MQKDLHSYLVLKTGLIFIFLNYKKEMSKCFNILSIKSLNLKILKNQILKNIYIFINYYSQAFLH